MLLPCFLLSRTVQSPRHLGEGSVEPRVPSSQPPVSYGACAISLPTCTMWQSFKITSSDPHTTT